MIAETALTDCELTVLSYASYMAYLVQLDIYLLYTFKVYFEEIISPIMTRVIGRVCKGIEIFEFKHSAFLDEGEIFCIPPRNINKKLWRSEL